MAASFIGVVVSESASTNSLACAFHPSTAVGDVLAALVFKINDEGSIEVPTGWEEDANAQKSSASGQDRMGTVLTKVVNSADVSAGTVNITHTEGNLPMSVHMITSRGIDTGSIYDVTPVTGHYLTPTNDSSPNMPELTTVNNGALVITFWGCGQDEIITCIQPSGFTPADVTTLTPGTSFVNRQSFSAYQIVATPTAISGEWTGTRVVENTTEGYTATISLKPAVAGGRIMSSLANHGGLAGHGGIAGIGGGLAA